MPSCLAPGCTGSYKTKTNEKVQLFSVPRDDELRKKWQIALKRQKPLVAKVQAVCEKHFLSSDIIRIRRLLSPEGVELGVSPYQRPRLATGSVPCLFPWTEVIPSNNKKENILKPICEIQEVISLNNEKENILEPICETQEVIPSNNEKKNIQEPIRETQERNESSESCLNTKEQGNLTNGFQTNNNTLEVNKSSEICLDTQRKENIINNVQTNNNLNLIEDFNFTNLLTSTTKLPTSWIRNNITYHGKTLISFSCLTCVMKNSTYYSFNLKEIIVDSTLQLNTLVLEKLLVDSPCITVKKSIASIKELEEYVRLINGLKVCQGCMLPEIHDHEKSDVWYSDKRNVIRHKTCTLLCRTSQCKSCRNAKRALVLKRKRHGINLQDKRSQDQKSQELAKLVESQKIYVHRLERKLTRSIQQKKKLQLMNLTLRKNLKMCQNKMALISEDRVLSRLRSNKFANNQCDVVQEILKASHCKNSSGRRYSENWLMLCMLLYLRSVSGYNFIRENNILPLPYVNTMRRNLVIIDKQSGFNSELFETFSKFLSEKEKIHKHGFLLIDENSINVCSQNPTYVGLEDFLEESNKLITTNDKANHELRLMFQPLYDTYVQPVAVFGSHGPVNGQVLSQLIVKAIILLEKSGAKIHGVITDGAATNRKFWSILGISGHKSNFKNYFKHPCETDRKIFIFSDTPHLIKRVRNRLYNIGSLQIDPDKPLIEWRHFNDMYEKESQFPAELRMCPKINNEHLVLNSSSKLRVGLAVQIFSQSVANALRNYAANDPQLNCWKSTAEFCSWMDQMFDALNRHENRGVLPDSEDFKVIEASLQQLNDWEEKVTKKIIPETAFLTTQTAEGLRVTLQSSLDLIRLLTKKYKFPAVPTGRINQDSLEVRSILRQLKYQVTEETMVMCPSAGEQGPLVF